MIRQARGSVNVGVGVRIRVGLSFLIAGSASLTGSRRRGSAQPCRGRVVALPKHPVPGVGAYAAIIDPQGNICGLWEDAVKQEGRDAMLDTPEIVRTDARPTAVIRFTIPREEIQSVMGPGIAEVIATVAAQGIGPAGPVFSYHLKMDPKIFDFEVGVPVTKPVTPAGRVRAGQLPAATAAKTVYRGPYEGLGSAWGEFMAWITTQGHTPAPALWECYVKGPESSPDPVTWSTELYRPLTSLGPKAQN